MESTNNQYKVYLNNIIDLARTIVIKSEALANTLNKNLLIYKGYDASNDRKNKWKYYLNISGEYHPTDTVMTVISQDTLEEIAFTKENLAVHKATKRAYGYGQRLYYDLLRRYPDNYLLIMGIINPVDINKAIAAKDYEILGYLEGYVEPNEYSLIPELNRWLQDHHSRWYNDQYNISDNLYDLTFLGTVYATIVPVVLSLRLAACNTYEAHSYHVYEKLKSHGISEKAIRYMTQEQRMLFYMNMPYIHRNPGSNDTLTTLIDWVLTKRDILTYDYRLHHDTSLQAENLVPEVKFLRRPINNLVDKQGNELITFGEMLDKESKLARSNKILRPDYEEDSKTLLESSLDNSVQTKVLETFSIDNTDAEWIKIIKVLQSHWLRLTDLGYYKAVINTTNPKTGERITLNSKDAVILCYYTMAKALGHTPREIPKFRSIWAVEHPIPTREQLKVGVDTTKYVHPNVITKALDMATAIEPVISIDAFYEQGMSLYRSIVNHENLAGDMEEMDPRAHVEYMVGNFYRIRYYRFAPKGALYDDWLSSKNINLDGLSTDQFSSMYSELLLNATGLSLNKEISKEDIQSVMTELISDLSSYSIHFVKDSFTDSYTKLGNIGVRIGNLKDRLKYHVKHPDIAVNAFDAHLRLHTNLDLGEDDEIECEVSAATRKHKVDLELPDVLSFDKVKQQSQVKIELSGLVMGCTYPGIDINNFDFDRLKFPMAGINDSNIGTKPVVDAWGNDFIDDMKLNMLDTEPVTLVEIGFIPEVIEPNNDVRIVIENDHEVNNVVVGGTIGNSPLQPYSYDTADGFSLEEPDD